LLRFEEAWKSCSQGALAGEAEKDEACCDKARNILLHGTRV
jgi:hypothetical protein